MKSNNARDLGVVFAVILTLICGYRLYRRLSQPKRVTYTVPVRHLTDPFGSDLQRRSEELTRQLIEQMRRSRRPDGSW